MPRTEINVRHERPGFVEIQFKVVIWKKDQTHPYYRNIFVIFAAT